MQFVVNAHDGKDVLEKRMEVRPRHLENMLRNKEHVICAGGILDEAGKPVLLSSGYASFEQHYDIIGNMRMRAYYDADGNPVNPPSVGYARFERKCDDAVMCWRKRSTTQTGA